MTPAECVDIKEDATAKVVTDNRCRGSKDPEGAGFSSLGIRTVFRRNDKWRACRRRRPPGMPQGLICGNRVERNCDGDVNVHGVDSDRRCSVRDR